MFIRRLLFAVLGIGLCSAILAAAQDKENRPVPPTSATVRTTQETASAKSDDTPANVSADGLAKILLRLESIEKRLAALEKPQRSENSDSPLGSNVKSSPKRSPECPLASADKTKTVKVVVLTKSQLSKDPNLSKLDTELARACSRAMQAGFKKNSEAITVVAYSLVEKYKLEHPNWETLGADALGKHFQADYVVEFQTEEFSLYEPGSANTFFRGRCDISIVVHDVHNSSEGPKWDSEYSKEFPAARGPIDTSTGSVKEFKQGFMTVISRELTWRFTAHSLADDNDIE